MKLWVLIRTQTLSTTNKIILMYTQYPFFPQGTPYSVDTYIYLFVHYIFSHNFTLNIWAFFGKSVNKHKCHVNVFEDYNLWLFLT